MCEYDKHECHSVKAAFRWFDDARDSAFFYRAAFLYFATSFCAHTSPERAAEYSPGVPSFSECSPGSAAHDRKANPEPRDMPCPPAASTMSPAARRACRQPQNPRSMSSTERPSSHADTTSTRSKPRVRKPAAEVVFIQSSERNRQRLRHTVLRPAQQIIAMA